ncbi:hypothetical protein IU443_28645 [Nocardia farcinica]|uniref:hypothetical protein n=1 Tax=Nocardia farcinica TaxID=37329 RepID=UPI0018944D00|nr:hypothetical protein [Nocardia farcinica]MBF6393902.1 hypothetical protein [Nocardia farcinica]
MNSESVTPPPSTPATSRDEYRIIYRNPETGEEFMLLADSTLWREKRRGLRNAGYQVIVQKRRIHTSSWQTVGDNQ